MEKKYFTKTGIELKVIQGEAKGDGLAIGFRGVVITNSELISIEASQEGIKVQDKLSIYDVMG